MKSVNQAYFFSTLRTTNNLIALAILAITLPTIARADITLPSVIADHMVLQRDMVVPVWGRAKAGQMVDVSIVDGSGKVINSVQAKSGDDGKFMARLPAMSACKNPLMMKVACAGESVQCSDVLVGEVWLCGGQSNMEWKVQGSIGGDTLAQTLPATVRCFTPDRRMSAHPEADLPTKWIVSTAESAQGFTAVGAWFAAKVGSTLDVPVGILSINWGGTRAEPWTPADIALTNPMFAAIVAEQQKAGATFEHMSPAQMQTLIDEQTRAYQEAISAYWKNLQLKESGFANHWETEPADAAHTWRAAQVPGVFGTVAGTESLADFDGATWWRRTITLPNSWAGRDAKLLLGPIDESDIVWINGIEVGRTTGFWQAPRTYSVPGATLHAGVNEIAVLIVDTQGAGGFSGKAQGMEMNLATTDGVSATDANSIALAGEWQWKRGSTSTVHAPNAPQGPTHPQAQSGSFGSMWNAMMAPVVPFAIRGALWYQGESNAGEADQYRELLPLMIRAWRAKWNEGNFPFGIVQLAGFRAASDDPVEGEWSALRDAQSNTVRVVPHCGLAVAIDVGDANDIHPRNKKTVADRLAAWALSQVYARGGEFSGPLYQSSSVQGAKMIVTFDHATGLAGANGAPVGGFAIAGSDGKFEWADAKIEGSTVILSSSKVQAPTTVRYAWSSNPVRANLVNSSGFPAPPFATDMPQTKPN